MKYRLSRVARHLLALALVFALLAGSQLGAGRGQVTATHLSGNPATYTLNADFDEGTAINVVHPIADQLQLDDTTSTLPFIWIAASARGTIIKIDTATGAILGEYKSAPDGRARNPSRTTVDANGNVWAGNRDESTGGQGSVVHVGLKENNQCVDRNGNSMIDTSTGLGDIRPWTNPGGVNDAGGVSSAEDECIIHYVRVSGDYVRHVSVDGNNNVWTAGNFGSDNSFDLVSPTGAILASTGDLPCSGYGGLVDGNGVLWSANRGPGASALLRYDTMNTITTADDTFTCIPQPSSYGLAVDTNGFIWHSQFELNTIRKYTPAGVLVGTFATGGAGGDRGVAVTPADNNVWVANSFGSNVSHLDNAGAVVAVLATGATPTGVSVDAAGKVWATNLSSNDASRIDPSTNSVDLTVSLGAGAGPYNYGDMTGSTVLAAPTQGTWTIIHDTASAGAEWGDVSWNASTPSDSTITVQVSSSEDGVIFGPTETATNGGDLSIANGRYIKAVVTFTRATTGESPVLYDITFNAITNQPPDCSNAAPSIGTIWPPNHQFVAVNVMGVTDPDSDTVTITITSIRQDEKVLDPSSGSGNFSPDGTGVGTGTAMVRAERNGNPKTPGNGPVYHIGFTADDGNGDTCSGTVKVGVPHDQGKGKVPVDDGPLYDSTIP
ncbi:MAG: hypothetical protein FJ315_01130 [SAR202 cluster bacterium]|nr:hypothetical protein [SAR202 cluster bacterium]